jgi:hypothetical protein
VCRLCCLPFQIKAKYYPAILLVLFSVLFGVQIDLFVGMAVGYMHHYRMLKGLELSTTNAKNWESKFPFKLFSSRPGIPIIIFIIFFVVEFVTTDGAQSDLPTFIRTSLPQ